MSCKECGEKLIYDQKGTWGTLVGYSSPSGHGHDHDDNCLKRSYVCKNGHRKTVSLRRSCPACDWVGKADCFCHEGPKVDEWPEFV